jgi:predicted CopG family antitoxin
MKSATIPSIRVEPELREEVEGLLLAGESLSEFVEASVRESVRRRRNQAEFLARGMASLAAAKAEDVYVDPRTTFKKMQSMLDQARATAAKKKASRA